MANEVSSIIRFPLYRFAVVILSTLAIVAGSGCSSSRTLPTDPEAPAGTPAPMPSLQREFRGVWVATVANIDWPSRPGLSTHQQQAELRALFDRIVVLNMNAVIFQVRPTADAFYASALEPWSEYLTGEMGKAPDPYYDPLAFAVEEAHKRGLELHAWFNPFRAHHPTATGTMAGLHISNTHPEIVRTYGDMLWLDPGEEVARNHSRQVILDVVSRYDIDGIHLDDYFYPYPIQDEEGNEVPFPDETSWQYAVQNGETVSREDWRRQNVDRFIEQLYRAVKQEKPWVKVGISPFGIWRPGYPEQITGFDAYDRLYADARKWQQEGWLDYLSPQLYWDIDRAAQSYPVLLEWWEEQNTAGRHLWPGNYTSRIGFEDETAWHADEIVDQVQLTRAQPGATGNIHFSAQVLMKNADRIGNALAIEPYRTPALVPSSPWLDHRTPGKPEIAVEQIAGNSVLTMTPTTGEEVWLWIIRTRFGASWTMEIIPGWRLAHRLQSSASPLPPDEVFVSAVSRVGNEGPMAGVRQLK